MNNVMNLAMILIPESSNPKTVNIIQSYSNRSTCPNRCPLKNNGCYADSYHTSRQWDRCDDEGDKRYIANGHDLTLDLMSAVALHAKRGEKSILFRHNVAGDIALPNSDMIADERLNTIVESCNKVSSILNNIKLMGYTYTHCSLTMQNFNKVKKAQSKGFVVNFSCETIEEVKKVKFAGCNAVLTSVSPEETTKALKTEGLKAVQCPAQTNKDMSCKKCKLCARNREAVVIFAIHGNGSKKAQKVIMLKTAKVA